jgi:hypothetical protein
VRLCGRQESSSGAYNQADRRTIAETWATKSQMNPQASAGCAKRGRGASPESVTAGAITVNGPAPSFPLTSTSLQLLHLGSVVGLQVFFNNDFADNFVLSFTPALGVPGPLQVALAATTPWSSGLGLDSFSGSVTGTVSSVPEPSSIVLLIPALVGLVLLRKWRPRLPLARTDPQATPA